MKTAKELLLDYLENIGNPDFQMNCSPMMLYLNCLTWLAWDTSSLGRTGNLVQLLKQLAKNLSRPQMQKHSIRYFKIACKPKQRLRHHKST